MAPCRSAMICAARPPPGSRISLTSAALLLLYGSGLRISEALALTPKDAPSPGRDVLHIRGKGGRERLVPVLPITQAAIARYMELCKQHYRLERDGPLFLGAKGGRL